MFSPNPLPDVDGAQLREQSALIIELAAITADKSNFTPEEHAILDGLVHLLDAIRSHCHDHYGIDCLLQDEDEPAAKYPCPVCGNAHGCGSDDGLPDAGRRVKPTGDFSECPKCGAGDVQGGPIEIEGNRAVQECSCSECDAAWLEWYAAEQRVLQ